MLEIKKEQRPLEPCDTTSGLRIVQVSQYTVGIDASNVV